MSVATWIVVGWFGLNALFAIGTVGRKRDPITPGGAIVCQFIYGGLVFAALKSAGVL